MMIKKSHFLFVLLIPLVSLGLSWSLSLAGNAAYDYRPPRQPYGLDEEASTVIGAPQTYAVQKADTLLDIARNFDLGFSELQLLYRKVDPWTPPEGMTLTVPTLWVLPEGKRDGILINIPEMRLYYFSKGESMVKTFPIGIGVTANVTPVGRYFIREKVVSPRWHIPRDLRNKYDGKKFMPPGPENPLGSHWMGLSIKGYGIHGTNLPWAVGRLVTHGCIRLYPEDIPHLYSLVPIGTPVEITYEPAKIGYKDGRVFLEVHEDIYRRVPDLYQSTLRRLEKTGIRKFVAWEKVREALTRRSGLPVEISSDSILGR
jgi:L,D-transpeptidase ErfK/SrfK